MKLTIEGTPDEIKKALQAMQGEERLNEDGDVREAVKDFLIANLSPELNVEPEMVLAIAKLTNVFNKK